MRCITSVLLVKDSGVNNISAEPLKLPFYTDEGLSKLISYLMQGAEAAEPQVYHRRNK